MLSYKDLKKKNLSTFVTDCTMEPGQVLRYCNDTQFMEVQIRGFFIAQGVVNKWSAKYTLYPNTVLILLQVSTREKITRH